MRFVLPALVALLVAAAPAEAVKLKRCKGQPAFNCGTLVVPLDYANPGAAKVHLRFAVERGRRPVLIALTGGPGQPGVAFADAFAFSLQAAQSRYRIAVLDQRGTGKSGVLNCPALQKLGALSSVGPAQVAACAERIGPRRAFYTTRDTVEDLEALRVALGAGKVALMGVSYGTYVAQQYARVHPDKTRALILDSVMGADGFDPFLLDSYAATPRVLREQCARRRCRNVTSDPVADLTAVIAKVVAGTVSGRAFDAGGRARTVRYRSADELVNLLIAGDLNPFLQPALPGALAAAARGDLSLLLRLRRIANGGTAKLSELSFGLNVTTTCEDAALPYALTTPFEQRDPSTGAALAALDPALFAPFDAATVLRTSLVEDCSRWPLDTVHLASDDPLPDVPALVLSGRLDLRTPMENGTTFKQELPGATLVRVAGTGHDVLDSDITGCAAVALSRFVRRRSVGSPCKGKSNQVAVFPRPPRTLSDFRSARGVGGRRGRALFAALDTAVDARVTALQLIYAGLSLRGGGLHAGRFRLSGDHLTLSRYAYVPGLRVSGTLVLGDGTMSGRVRVDGPRGTDGALRLYADGSVAGRLGGRNVSYGRGRARAARGAARPPLAAVVDTMRATALMRGRPPVHP